MNSDGSCRIDGDSMGIQWNTNRDKVVERLKVTETFVKRTNELIERSRFVAWKENEERWNRT